MDTNIQITSVQEKNFSFHKVIEDSTLLIPENQHMITTSIELDGFLEFDGGVVFL